MGPLRWAVAVLLLLQQVAANYPLFDESTTMRVLLVPWDTRVGSAIYRLRATDSDYDYPLEFDVQGRMGKSLLRIVNLPCNRNSSVCEANVILAKALEKNRVYKFSLSVRDAQGDQTDIQAELEATPGSSVAALDTAFPRYSTLIMVPENTKVGAELEYFLVRKSSQHARHAYLELSGSPLFKMKQRLAGNSVSNGSMILLEELDYEKQNLYSLHLAATDPFTNTIEDTRNIVGFDLAVVVSDVQDTPPVFIQAPPVTMLPANIKPGDLVLKVMAEDGDKGNPREIRYGLLTQNNPFTPFFEMDESTGELHMKRSLDDLRLITKLNTPVVLRVVAEEVITARDSDGDNSEKMISSEAELAIILPGSLNTPPQFESESYVATIPENSQPGTKLTFTEPWMTKVKDSDQGLGSVYSLSLIGDNGTFEIIPPHAVTGSQDFTVLVKNNVMLDFENHQTLNFKILAKEVSQPGQHALSAMASVTVMLSDGNDNAPAFQQPQYTATLQENATAGTHVAQVRADDVDTGVLGDVRYTKILGAMNDSLRLDPATGIITVSSNNHKFDREYAQEYKFDVEARDEGGSGKASTVPLVISVVDVNDHAPKFELPMYDLYLAPDNMNFTTKVFLKAMDGDAEPPNNEIRYEIISGNFANKFELDPMTGELRVIPRRDDRENLLKPQEPSLFTLLIRAYDLGVPHKWGTAEARIHSGYVETSPQGSVVFLVPNSPTKVLSDLRATERMLMQLTGGKVHIKEVRPFKPGEAINAADLAPGASHTDKSVVVATVSYSGEPAVVDIAEMQQRLMANQTATLITKEVITEYRADTSALFWFMVFFTLALLIGLIALIICFLFTGCPLYINRKETPPPPPPRQTEEVRLVLERPDGMDNDKFVIRREAWSADGHDRYVQFNRRNILTLDPKPHLQDNYSTRSEKMHRHHHNQQPNVIYTREMQQHDQHQHHNHHPHGVQMMEEAIMHLDTPMALDLERPTIVPRSNNFSTEVLLEEADEEDSSVRRHEAERGSDIAHRRIIPSSKTGVVEVLTLPDDDRELREQHYSKAGNAEVLRILSHPDDDSDHQSRQMGKDMLMRRFMEDQSITVLEDDEEEELVVIGREDTDDEEDEDDAVAPADDAAIYHAGDTKANILRRQQANKNSASNNRSRSQSLPKRGEQTNLNKKKSVSTNSGLEKANKVTFASPKDSDDEDDEPSRHGSRADQVKKSRKVEETPKKTVLKKHTEPAKGAATTSKSTAADKKSTTKTSTVSKKDAGGDAKKDKAKSDSPPLRKSKVELKGGARDSPSPSVRKGRTEEAKSTKSSLQAAAKGKDRRHSPSPAASRKPLAADEIKVKRPTSKSPSPTTQAKKQGESSSKPSAPKDQEINSKHTKTSLTRLEKSTVKSTKAKNSEPREEEEEEEAEDGDDAAEEVSITIEAEPEGKAAVTAADGVEMSMQTDVTLVPLINSNRTQLEDEDLDSGIAMGEERNKRLTYLTNKKSIFTIAYDDVGIQKIRANSASPVS